MNAAALELAGHNDDRCTDPWTELTALWPRSIQRDVAMGAYTTLRAGGRAAGLVAAETMEELRLLRGWLTRHNMRWHLLGRGSNLLVTSRGFPGLFIQLQDEFCRIIQEDDQGQDGQVRLRVGSGCSVAALTGWCIRHEVHGFEFMAGIPGTIGGGVRMNAGAWGRELGSLISGITVMDHQGALLDIPGDGLVFGYRSLEIPGRNLNDLMITGVHLHLSRGPGEAIRHQCLELMRKRQAKQPLVAGSAGSFFKNPPGDSAGRLIEAAGLKGFRRGRAMVSTRHANFIINLGGATAADIEGLWQEVQKRVYQHSGVMLQPEVVII